MRRRTTRLARRIRTRTVTKIKYRTRRIGSAMKRRYKRSSRRFGGGRVPVIGGVLRNPWIQKTAAGLGMGTIAALITARFAPQFTQIASLAGAYAGGGLEGVIGGEAVKAISGAPSALTGVLGGNTMQNGGNGFA